MSTWQLPTVWQGHPLHTDYRDILEIISYLNDPSIPGLLAWEIAMALFYEDKIQPGEYQQAMEYLSLFLCGGFPEGKPGPKLLDWETDAAAIISDINKTAGREIRSEPYIHWWTFLSWFHGIGEGQLSTLVSIRDKLARGKKLEDWEKDFYRQHKKAVDLPKRLTPQEQAEIARLEALLQ